MDRRGSTATVRVDLAVNPDTLDGYNWEKYRNDRSLYYEMLPETCYSFEGEGIVIRAGTEYSNVPIRFYLDKIDKEKNYILPISIVNVSEFSIGDPKYSTILMNVILSNEYSGPIRFREPSAKSRRATIWTCA